MARWSAQTVSTVDRSQRGRPTRVAEATKGLPLGRKRDLARWLHAWYSPGGRGEMAGVTTMGAVPRGVCRLTSESPRFLGSFIQSDVGRWTTSRKSSGLKVSSSTGSWPACRPFWPVREEDRHRQGTEPGCARPVREQHGGRRAVGTARDQQPGANGSGDQPARRPVRTGRAGADPGC
jgi:hypothetical protein